MTVEGKYAVTVSYSTWAETEQEAALEAMNRVPEGCVESVRMVAPWDVGQRLRCVNASCTPFTLGGGYEFSGEFLDDRNGPHVGVVGFLRGRAVWYIGRFRPVYRVKAPTRPEPDERSAWYWRRRGDVTLDGDWEFLCYGRPDRFWLNREYVEVRTG